METLETYGTIALEKLQDYLPKLALAILVLLIGFWLIKRLRKVLNRALNKAQIDDAVAPFLLSLVDIGLKVMLLFSAVGILGVETASFLAVLAAAGFAVGLALQGSLGNFAAGVIILIFRPYKIGDWVEIQDKFGKVEEIQIFNTHIVTPGKKVLIIPNGQVIEGIVTNFSTKGFIRIEINVTMPYEESFPRVKEVILRVLKEAPKVNQELAPEIGIESFDSHSIILAVRPYVDPDDYWEVTFDVHERIKKAFHEENIKVAYSEGVEIGNIGE